MTSRNSSYKYDLFFGGGTFTRDAASVSLRAAFSIVVLLSSQSFNFMLGLMFSDCHRACMCTVVPPRLLPVRAWFDTSPRRPRRTTMSRGIPACDEKVVVPIANCCAFSRIHMYTGYTYESVQAYWPCGTNLLQSSTVLVETHLLRLNVECIETQRLRVQLRAYIRL